MAVGSRRKWSLETRSKKSEDEPETVRRRGQCGGNWGRPVPYGWRRPSLPVLLLLPCFADRDFVPSPVRSSLVATQEYPSSPGSRASTVCVDLDDLDSDCSWSIVSSSPVSPVVVDQGVVSSVDFCESAPPDISMVTSRFQALNPRQSPVAM